MTSEYTRASRTRRAINCAYWAPKSTTRTGRAGACGAVFVAGPVTGQVYGSGYDRRVASPLPPQHPRRHPMRHRTAVGAVADRISHQPPPVALLAQAPAAQPTLDNLVHLQPGRVIAAAAVRLTRKQRGQVDQHGDGRLDRTERLGHRLTAVADRLQITHCSIIRSIGLFGYSSMLVRASA